MVQSKPRFALEHCSKVLREGEVEVVGLLFRDGTLVGTGLDLIEQDIARPAEAGGGAEIPKAGGGGAHAEERVRVVAPRHSGNHFSHNL